MKLSRLEFLASLGTATAVHLLGASADTESSPKWPDSKIKAFLSNAKVIKSKTLSTGITNSMRLTLSLDGETQDAHFQSIDEAKPSYQTPSGVEMNFRDTWKFNVAGYRLDRLLGLKMTPPSVQRAHERRQGSFTWWIKGAMMEVDRTRKKLEPPEIGQWNDQMQILRLFDQLIFNTDRNLQNVLIDAEWSIWMIDHTRAFRWHKDLKDAKNLGRCERKLYARLQSLTEDEIAKATKPFLDEYEIRGLMARREKIVDIYRNRIAKEGESGVLYDYSRG